MKTKIQKCNFKGKESTNGRWWKWIETCDKCGAIVQDYRTLSSEEPDPSEVDYCYDCLRYLIKNKVKFEKAKG